MHSKLLLLLAAVPSILASPSLSKRSGFNDGQPIDDNGKGAPILGKSFTYLTTLDRSVALLTRHRRHRPAP
jgi:hypothetical protein